MTDTPDPAALKEAIEPNADFVRQLRSGAKYHAEQGDIGLEFILGQAADRIEALAPLQARVEEMEALFNTPEVDDFARGAVLEATHQRTRWPSDHDEGKSPFDWFWLISYLAQKAASSAVVGDIEKAKHHTISTAAALANWHLALAGGDSSMRPGIATPSQPVGQEQREGWREMSEAPFDETPILIENDRGMFVVEFDEGWSPEGWWMVSDGKDFERPLRGENPFHWRPLPPARAALNNGDGGQDA